MSLVTIQREKYGVSMTETARRAGIGLDKLSRIESGQRKLQVDEVARLARAIGCKPSDLIPELPDACTPVRIGEK